MTYKSSLFVLALVILQGCAVEAPRNAQRDIALIKISESNLPAMSLWMDGGPSVGDPVYAIGTPIAEKLDAVRTLRIAFK